MKASISTTLVCQAETFWRYILKPKSLRYVASPIVKFFPCQGEPDSTWVEGKLYEFRLFFLGLLPLGRHQIQLVEIDMAENVIRSRESGQLAKVWNHTIRFCNLDHTTMRYTDEIEIRAGLLSFPIWVFAQFFYRHRQRRWKRFLRSLPVEGDQAAA